MPLLALPTEILSYIIQLAITKPPFTRPYETFNLVDRYSHENDYGTLSEEAVRALALSCQLLARLVLKEATSDLVFPSTARLEGVMDAGGHNAVRTIALEWRSIDEDEDDADIAIQLRFMHEAPRLAYIAFEFVCDESQTLPFPDSLAKVLASSANLVELTLAFGRVAFEAEQQYLDFLGALSLPQLRRLNVDGLHLLTSRHLLLDHFPRLSHLALSDLLTISTSDLKILLSRAPPTLRHLALPSMHTARDCASLTAFIPGFLAEGLQTLAIGSSGGPHHATSNMRRYRCLQELDISGTWMEIFDPVDLPPSLRKLRLTLDREFHISVDRLRYLKQMPNLLLVGLADSALDHSTLVFFTELREEGRIRVEGTMFG